MDNNQFAQIRQILTAHKREIEVLQNEIGRLRNAPAKRSPQEEIDAIAGRRVAFTYVGSQTFTTSNDGARGSAINMTVSQDGPFIWTHYPFVLWRSTAPSNATDFGKWRPVQTFYPSEHHAAVGTATNVINISYEIADSGSQRNFQNAACPPILSQYNALIPLSAPTLFAPNTVISFTPTYEDINLGGSTATTTGTLVVAFPGYRIVNM